ncbi:glycoside hydrolase family 15 protein, partial [Acidianus sp. RZ1]|uniref:glycoside hydrolase family 15 protein n=1 Tax=Acidianus sp. RZ1 TaxID=1540082 RepID=UPI0014916D5B
DGERTWLDTEFSTTVSFLENTGIVNIQGEIKTLVFNAFSFVDLDEPNYYSIIKFTSKDEKPRKIKVFFVHDFNIYSNPYGDTAFYDPFSSSIVHYKSKRYIGVKLVSTSSPDIEYTTTKDDALSDVFDGKLSGYPVAHGNVMFAVGKEVDLNPNRSAKLYHIITAAKDLESIRAIMSRINGAEIETRFVSDYMYWRSWLDRSRIRASKLDELEKLYKISLQIIKSHMDINGSVIASSDFSFVNIYGDSYQYCWPRDAAYAAYALDIAGYGELAVRHFNFIREVVSSEGFLYHKYNPNKTLASSWHPWIFRGKGIYPIQEDETALEVWAISNHYERYRDLDELGEIYKKFVRPAMKFMMNFIEDGLPKPSFDLWEERYGIHTYTVSTVYGGLTKGALFAKDMGDESLSSDAIEVAKSIKEIAKNKLTDNGRLVRRIDENGNLDLTLDSSVYAAFFFDMINPRDQLMENTMNSISKMLNVNGGIIRYENDYYQRRKSQPNPWIITTLWVAEFYFERGDMEKGKALLNWVLRRSTTSLLLPEQVDPENLQPVSVIPLVWSHAEFIIALNKYINNLSPYDRT